MQDFGLRIQCQSRSVSRVPSLPFFGEYPMDNRQPDTMYRLVQTVLI